MIFLTCQIIFPDTHKAHWIRDYPISLCPADTKLDKNIYICPFDIKSREIYKKLIDDAHEVFIFVNGEFY